MVREAQSAWGVGAQRNKDFFLLQLTLDMVKAFADDKVKM